MSPSSAETTADSRELKLVQDAEFRIIQASVNEAKLQNMLERYLAPLILKTASEHMTVRTATVRVLKRLEPFMEDPKIVLPVGTLLDQFKSNQSAIVKEFDLKFIKHSLERIDSDERRRLVPIALRGFAIDWNHSTLGVLFLIILRLLLDVKIPPRGSEEEASFRNELGLEDPADAMRLIEAMGVLLRLRATTAHQDWSAINPEFARTNLSGATKEKFQSMKLWDRMPEIKGRLVALLASGAFTDEEKLFPAICAASGTDLRAAAAAEDLIKRSAVSMDNAEVVRQLSQAYSNLPVAHRIRILGMFCKSSVAANMTDWVSDVAEKEFLAIYSGPDDEPPANPAAWPERPSGVLERNKLSIALFNFLAYTAKTHTAPAGKTFMTNISELITRFLKRQGWPRPLPLSPSDCDIRIKAYSAIGDVSRHHLVSFKCRMKLADFLLRSLAFDPYDEVVVSILSSISSLAMGIPRQIGKASKSFKETLLKYMGNLDAAVRSTRYAVVTLANRCLPWTDITGRWIDILAIAGQPDEATDVVELGRQGLDLRKHWRSSEAEDRDTFWRKLVLKFFTTSIGIEGPGNDSDDLYCGSQSGNLLDNFQGSRIGALPIALRFCQRMLLRAALNDVEILKQDTLALEVRVMTDLHLQLKVRKYLESILNKAQRRLDVYLKACLDGVWFKNDEGLEPSESQKEECLRCFVEVAMLAPQAMTNDLVNDLDKLLPLVKSANKNMRLTAARAAGILVSHTSNNSGIVRRWLESILKDGHRNGASIDVNYNARAGYVLALGFVTSRCVYRGIAVDTIDWPFHILLDKKAPLDVQDAAMEGFSQAWTTGIGVPPVLGEHSLDVVIDFLQAQALDGNEKAILALGSLGLGLADQDDNLRLAAAFDPCPAAAVQILEFLLSLNRTKRPEILFAVGDAITAVTGRFEANYMKLGVDIDPQLFVHMMPARTALLNDTLDKLCEDCRSLQPSLMKASGIWLFCLLQYGSALPVVQARLSDIHTAFMHLIASRDDLCQETASRGLQLVYERGDSKLQKALTGDIISAFTGHGPRLKVDKKTELFEPGALPTGQESSITTYQDIVSLANEVGDQQIVYKLMSLATNATTWSTRSAFGRFGLGSILSDYKVDPQLYPKLFRCRFDPNTNVQRSMESLWKDTVKDPKSVLDEYFEVILLDLLSSILGREWRVRQASCAAIADLLQGRRFDQYRHYYTRIWASALKVLDDVKGSVREAALRLCMALSRGLEYQLDAGDSSTSARAMMQEVMPFLMSDNGIASSVQDVRRFALNTVIKVAKRAGKMVQPFIPIMVPKLLDLLSLVEPEQINFQYQRLEGETRDEIDKLRSQVVNQSPIMEAIEECLRYVNTAAMSELLPVLGRTAKGALGLQTKIGCSRVFTTLAMQHVDTMGTMAPSLLNSLRDLMLDKNDEASRAYARAAAYMLKAIPEDECRVEFCEACVKLYVRADDEARRQRVAQVVGAFSSHAPDTFSLVETILLPLAYVGRHDGNEQAGAKFDQVWKQHAGNARTAVRYLSEIVELAERCLGTGQWSLQHTAAFAMAQLTTDVADISDCSGSGIPEASLEAIWLVFDRCLALKTFTGKEKLLESLPPFLQQADALWQAEILDVPVIKRIVMREAKRQNADYRIHAFRCLWRCAQARQDLVVLSDIIPITAPFLTQLGKQNDGKSSSTEVSKEDKTYSTAKAALEAAARGYYRSTTTDFRTFLVQLVDMLQPHFSSPEFGVVKRQVWYDCVCDLMADAAENTTVGEPVAAGFNGSTVLAQYIESADVKSANVGTEAQRVRRANAVAAIIKAQKSSVFGDADLPVGLERAVELVVEDEASLDVVKAWREVLKGV
ncbi:hypothetical protein CDD81_1436 [Ophiocordyceps australis]|uniref:Proteasome component ECM29 n=1 Tax=Ophiocordyceps australis TaxID=1399860 RepID=A0A2C5XZL6_9HYPO|nr:hypothetical protein CDD81_1436 [Ophiocordyceps australis]